MHREARMQGMGWFFAETRRYARLYSKSKLIRKATVHTLRHSFDTHLLENSIDLRFIRALMGHKAIKNAVVYKHLNRASTDLGLIFIANNLRRLINIVGKDVFSKYLKAYFSC